MLQMATRGIGSYMQEKRGGSVERNLAHKVVLQLLADERLQHKGYVW